MLFCYLVKKVERYSIAADDFMKAEPGIEKLDALEELRPLQGYGEYSRDLKSWVSRKQSGPSVESLLSSLFLDA
jgi:hypothetical protein